MNGTPQSLKEAAGDRYEEVRDFLAQRFACAILDAESNGNEPDAIWRLWKETVEEESKEKEAA